MALGIVAILAGCATTGNETTPATNGTNRATTNVTNTATTQNSAATNSNNITGKTALTNAPTSKPTTTNIATNISVEQAIAKANHVYGAIFPAKPGTSEGAIHEGPLQHKATVPGKLQTKVKQVGKNTYLVIFVEQWDASNFPVKGSKTTGQYQWTYKVTPNSARIQSEGGDYPPQNTK